MLWKLLRYTCLDRGCVAECWLSESARYSADTKRPLPIVILPKLVSAIDEELSPREIRTMSMLLEEQIDSATIERLKKQATFLLRMYRAELAKNPTSRAADPARSNVMALRHTIGQIHGRLAKLRLA
jgi:hypothetical protein